MYKLKITTKYNTINLVIEDFNTPEIQEILEQPYIISVEMNEIKDNDMVKKRVKTR